MSGTIRVGVVAYHATGILRVDFDVDGGDVTSVTTETRNPDDTDWNGRSEYEFVYTIDTTALSPGSRTVHATAYPNTGTGRTLPDLVIQVDQSPSPTTYYVATAAADPPGNDSNPGSSELPFLTLNRACVVASSGDIIKVRDGDFEIPDQSGYAWTKYTTITPDTGCSPRLTSKLYLRSPFMKFDGMIFDKSASSQVVIQPNGATAHHSWFANCTLYGRRSVLVADGSHAGIAFNTDADHGTVTNCTIYDTGHAINANQERMIVRGCIMDRPYEDGINIYGVDCIATGNEVKNILIPPGWGLQALHPDLFAADYPLTNVIVRNNNCHDNVSQGIYLGIGDPVINVAVVNNLFGGDLTGTYYGMHLYGEFSPYPQTDYDNVLYEFNTILQTAPLRFDVTDGYAVDFIMRNSIFSPGPAIDERLGTKNDPVIDFNIFHSGATMGTNAISGDPLLVNGAGYDARLTAESPARGAGISGSRIRYDCEWNPRSVSSPSIGAFEYVQPGTLLTVRR